MSIMGSEQSRPRTEAQAKAVPAAATVDAEVAADAVGDVKATADESVDRAADHQPLPPNDNPEVVSVSVKEATSTKPVETMAPARTIPDEAKVKTERADADTAPSSLAATPPESAAETELDSSELKTDDAAAVPSNLEIKTEGDNAAIAAEAKLTAEEATQPPAATPTKAQEDAETAGALSTKEEGQEKEDRDDFVPGDMEHIVATGASESAGQSMESLRDAVRKAREAAGTPREALPPGFEDDMEGQASGEEASIAKDEDNEEPAEDLKDAVRKAMQASGMSATGDNGDDAASSNSTSDSDDEDGGSSSSDDSDSEDSDEEDAGEVDAALGVGADDYDDDDDEAGAGGAGEAPKTKNEVVAPDVELPAIQTLSPGDLAMVRPLGQVHSIVDSVVVVAQDVTKKEGEAGNAAGSASAGAGYKGKQAVRGAPIDSTGRRGEADEGEYSVLDTGSLLCFEDGKVLGLVFETFGSVHAPLYSIRYPSAAAIDRDVVQVGRVVCYLPNASTYVLTRVLKAMKGSDASNIYDEEVGEDEVEFSDDEAEAEAKRKHKESKRARQEANGTDRGNKRQKGSGKHPQHQNPQQGQQQQQQQQQQLRHGGHPRPSLPARPMAAALPARPNFDIDAPPSRSGAGGGIGGRTILSYDDAGAGGDAGVVAMAPRSSGAAAGAAVLGRPPQLAGLPPVPRGMGGGGGGGSGAGPAAIKDKGRGIAGLPPKPASLPQSPHSSAATSPALPQGSPAFNATPPMGASSGRFNSPPGSAGSPLPPVIGPPQHYPRSFGGQHAVSPPVGGGHPQQLPPPPTDSAGGHYNPHFAGYWAQHQQQQQPPAYWGQPVAAPGPSYGGYPGQMYPPAHYAGQQYPPHVAPSATAMASGPTRAPAQHQQRPQQQQQHQQQAEGPPTQYGGYGMGYGSAGYPAGAAAGGGYPGYNPAAAAYGGSGYGYPGGTVRPDANAAYPSAYPTSGGVPDAGEGGSSGSYDPKRPSYPGQASPASGYPPPPA